MGRNYFRLVVGLPIALLGVMVLGLAWDIQAIHLFERFQVRSTRRRFY